MNEYTPGLHKFIQHIDHIESMRKGHVIAPIHVSVWPTSRCNFDCKYCCCRNQDKTGVTDLDFNDFKHTIKVLGIRGTKAIEFSGGGEPLLWPYFSEAVQYCRSFGLKVSLITNGTMLEKIPRETLAQLAWLRISYQSLEHVESIDYRHIWGIKYSGSFIVSCMADLGKLVDLHHICKNRSIPLRVAVSRPCSNEFANCVRLRVESLGEPLFFSDKEAGMPQGCYMAWIRAAIDWRGNFIPCPSVQLRSESLGRIPNDFILCHINKIEEWLHENRVHDLGYRCSYCNCGKVLNDFYHSISGNITEDVDFV